MKLKKIIGMGSILLVLGGTLTACADNDDDASAKTAKTYKQAKENGNKAYKLAFFENRASNDTQNVYYTLGYYKNNTLIKKNLDSKSDHYSEIVTPDLEKPFVVIKDNHYYIHRPPYSEYNQPLIKGKVTAKEND